MTVLTTNGDTGSENGLRWGRWVASSVIAAEAWPAAGGMRSYRGDVLKACLNGPRLPEEHPALPVTPEQLAADAVDAVRAGAAMVHAHIKDSGGRDTLHPSTVAEALDVMRAATPGTPIGLTTGAWTAPTLRDRLTAIHDWIALPDFASVNWHEEGAEQVARALLDREVQVEAGLWTEAALATWLGSPVRADCTRILLELPSTRDEARTTGLAHRMLTALETAGNTIPVLLHGEDASAWNVLRLAKRLGLHTRIGLEDTLFLPDEAQAPDNAALVRTALAV